MLYQIVLANPNIQHILPYCSNGIQLMVSWENEFFFLVNPALNFNFLGLQMHKTLNDFHPAVLLQNILPQIGCSVSIGVFRISFSVVCALIERQPVGSTAI